MAQSLSYRSYVGFMLNFGVVYTDTTSVCGSRAVDLKLILHRSGKRELPRPKHALGFNPRPGSYTATERRERRPA
jgi:hypothetical protein